MSTLSRALLHTRSGRPALGTWPRCTVGVGARRGYGVRSGPISTRGLSVDEFRQVLARFKQGEVSAYDALRAMLAFPSWRVWVDGDGRPETVELDDGTTLVIAESATDEGREFDGRFLVRDVAPRVGGMVFDPDESWGTVLRPEQLPVMRPPARPNRWTNKFSECCAVLRGAVFRLGDSQPADRPSTGP